MFYEKKNKNLFSTVKNKKPALNIPRPISEDLSNEIEIRIKIAIVFITFIHYNESEPGAYMHCYIAYCLR